MWHKVNPVAFRTPYIKSWKSSWYEDKKTYSKTFSLDVQIRDILNIELKWLPIWDVLISRGEELISISIYTSKSALILWKTWENVERMEKIISNKFWIKVVISIKEVKKPELNAKIVAYMISNQIEKRMPYKRAIKTAISKAMEKWAKWIKVKVWWRLNWADIARKETFKEWNIPTQTIRSDIDYCNNRAETVYWALWLKVWIYKWSIYKK